MSQLPTIGAHAALLGVAAFEGSVRQVIYSTNYLTSSIERAASQQSRASQAAAANMQRQSELVAKAAETEAARVAAAKEAEAARIKAANDRIIADQARVAAEQAAQGAEKAGATAKQLGQGAGSMLGNEAANAAGLAAQAAANAAALEKQAAASEKAAQAAENMAARTGKAAQQASAELTAFGNSAAASASTAAVGFEVGSTLIIAALLAIVATVAVLTASVLTAGATAIKLGADYSQAMNTVQALTGDTNSKMSELNDTIVQIGTTTTASMTDAARAAGELAKGGVSVQDSMDGALKSVVNLSTASTGELELADAAKAVANGMAAFNLHGAESVRVADAITGVAQSTTASYNDLAHSLQQVGTVAHSLNYSIEDTYTAVGLLALNGIKGSDAGTALRTMFQHLEHPSKQATQQLKEFNVSLYDAQGNARPLRDVVINLEKAFGQQAIAAGKLTQAQRDYALATIFGTDGQRAALSLINQGVEGYDRLAQAQRELTAEDVAGKMLIPLNAQLAILANNINAAAVQFGQAFEPALQKAVGVLLGFANGIATNTAALTLLGNTISALATGNGFDALYTQITNVFGENTGNKIIEFVNLFRNIGQAVADYILPAFDKLGEAISNALSNTGNVDQFSAVMTTIAQGARIVAAIIGFVVEKIADFINLMSQIPEGQRFIAIAAALALINPVLVAIMSLLLLMPKAVEGVLTALIAIPPIGATIGAAFDALGTALITGVAAWGDIFSTFGTIVQNVMSNVGTVIQSFLSAVGGVFSAIGTQARAFADALGQGIQNALSALSPLVPVLEAIAVPFIVAIAIGMKFGEAMVAVAQTVGGALSALGQTIAAAVSGFGDSFNAVGEEFKIMPKAADESVENTNKALVDGLSAGVAAIGNIFSGLGGIVSGALSTVGATIDAVVKGFGDSFSAMGTEISQLWQGLWSGVVSFFGAVVAALGNAANAFVQGYVTLFNALGTVIHTVWGLTWQTVVEVFNNFVRTIVQNVATFANSVSSSFASAGNAIGNVWTQVWQGIVDIATRALNALAERLNGFFEALKASPVGEFVAGAVGGFKKFGEAAVGAMGELGAKVDEIQGGIQGQLQSLKDSLFATQGAFEGIAFTAPPALDSTAAAINRVGNAAESTAPAVQDFGDGGKKAAKDLADEMKRLQEIFEDTMRKLQNLADDTAQKIADAWRKHEEDMLKASQDFSNKQQDTYNKLYDNLAKEEENYQKNIAREVLRRGLQEQIDINRTGRQRIYEDQDTAHQRELDETRRNRQEVRELLEQSYQYQIEDQERAIKRSQDATEVGIRRANQAVQDGLREQQQIQSRALSAMFDAQNAQLQESDQAQDAARQAARDQMHAQQQLAQDLAKASSPEDRANIMQRYQEQQAQAAQRAQEQQQDLAIQAARKQRDLGIKLQQQAAEDMLKRQQQAQERGLSYSQEDADRARRNAQEDQDVMRQRANAESMRKFRLEQDRIERDTRNKEDDKDTADRRTREDGERGVKLAEDAQVRAQQQNFDNEDHTTRINNIIKEANTQILEQQRAYDEKQKQIDQSLADELSKITETYNKERRALIQSWQDAWNELLEKAPDVQGALESMFGTFMAQVEATDSVILGLINDLRTAIGLQAQLGLNPNTNNTPSTQGSTAGAEDQGVEQSAPDVPDFAHGGIVPGKWGSAQHIIAHGGEVYMGLHNQLASYMPTAMALASLGTQANTQNTVINNSQITNITNNVSASYANTQSPATIAMDLQALGAMVRR